MLLGQRRSSVDSFISEEDAAKALKEQEENLRLFKERVQTGHKFILFLSRRIVVTTALFDL